VILNHMTTAMLFNLRTPRLVGRGGGDAIDIQGIGLHADLSDTTLALAIPLYHR
jgi:hypothetical protein